VERSDQSARESHGAARIIVFNEKKEEREKREIYCYICMHTHNDTSDVNNLRDTPRFEAFLHLFFHTNTHTRV
jgi:hypothetical protein